MSQPVNQEHEDVLNFAHSLPSGLTQEQIYVRIHERAMQSAAVRIDAAIAAHNEAVSEQERLAAELANCRAPAPESQPAAPDVLRGMTCWTEDEDGALCQCVKPADEITNPEGVFVRLSTLRAALAAPVKAAQYCVQWIGTADRLPTDGETVLIQLREPDSPESGMWPAQWLAGSKTFESNVNGWVNAEDVSHWLPLPKLPAMEAQRHE